MIDAHDFMTQENKTVELGREDLLKAIDYEISHRESLTSRHGINLWSFAAALTALLWAAITELTDQRHLWSQTLLVFFVASLGLKTLAAPLSKRIIGCVAMPLLPTRGLTFSQLLFHTGITPSLLAFCLLETILFFALALYLAFQGFVLLSVFGLVTFGSLFLLVAISVMLCFVKIPLRLSSSQANASLSGATGILIPSLGTLTLGVAVMTMIRVGPMLNKSDVRLGCIIAAAFVVVGLLASLPQPPGLAQLRGLRMRLAFNAIDISTAQREAEHILLGPPRENYLVAKAKAVASELGEKTRICENIVGEMDRVTSLAELVKTSPDEKIRQAALSEFCLVHKKILSRFNDLEAQGKRARKLRAQLDVRVQAAKVILDLQPDELDAIVTQVDEIGKASETARIQLRERAASSQAALEFLYSQVKGRCFPRQLTFNNALSAVFRN